MTFVGVVELIGKAVDVTGVAVIVAGALLAAVATATRRHRIDASPYEWFRRQLGRYILLGLEFLVAADIIRTVAITPTVESVLVLAGIVLIRTFLSFSLQVEVTGTWPWQKRPPEATGPR